jgi:hypothetical protein
MPFLRPWFYLKIRNISVLKLINLKKQNDQLVADPAKPSQHAEALPI